MGENTPIFIQEEPFIQKLLNRFLDKLERGDTRLSLTVQPKKYAQLFTPLFDFNNPQADYLWRLIQSLDKDYHILSIRKPSKPLKPWQPAYEGVKLVFNPENEFIVREWLNRPSVDAYTLIWQDALNKVMDSIEANAETLMEEPLRVPGYSAEELVHGLNLLGTTETKDHTLRELSARCFKGDSKFLEKRRYLLERYFPSVLHNAKLRSLLLNVHLPEQIEQVMLIENQETFVAAVEGRVPELGNTALVYSGGFRGSASYARNAQAATFGYLQPDVGKHLRLQFESWWCQQIQMDWPVWFWGDLDFSGMAILAALRHHFPTMQAWQPGYAPLLTALEQGHGHPFLQAQKEKQLDPGQTGCPYADQELLPALRRLEQAIDQEFATSL